FAEAKRFGTTTILNLTAVPQLIAQIESPIRCLWAPELIDIREPVDLDSVGTAALAPHALYTASAELFCACERRADLLTTHLSESREEMEMFRDGRGKLYEFLSSIGRDMTDCGGRTPTEVFLSIRDSSPSIATTKRWI